MKHYLEEQVFRSESLKIAASFIFNKIDTDGFSDGISRIFGPSPSEEDIFQKLCDSSEVRRSVFLNLFLKYSLGDGNLIWSLKGSDANSLSLLAYSIAGKGYIPDPVDEIILPESKGRDKGQLGNLIADLEERRTVIGPDRDGITEATIRMEAKLPIRYIYQEGNTDMYEKKETVEEIFGSPDIEELRS